MTGTISQWSPCNMKSLSACSHRERASQVFLQCPHIQNSRYLVKASEKNKKTTEIPSPPVRYLNSPLLRAACSSTLTAQEPHNTFQRVAKVIRCWQMSFVVTVTATIKLTISIITIFAPKVPIHKEHVFFCKYKEIHRMILYTTYNKYCVSYILLFEWMYWV